MSQDEKELLLKDLCARLPYEMYCSCQEGDRWLTINFIADNTVHIEEYPQPKYAIEDVRPYLRPVSSMTEEEMDRLFEILDIDKNGEDDDWIKINDCTGIKFFLPTGRWTEEMDNALGYLRSIHIDIHGLIGKGLALEAPEGMYNTKEEKS